MVIVKSNKHLIFLKFKVHDIFLKKRSCAPNREQTMMMGSMRSCSCSTTSCYIIIGRAGKQYIVLCIVQYIFIITIALILLLPFQYCIVIVIVIARVPTTILLQYIAIQYIEPSYNTDTSN